MDQEAKPIHYGMAASWFGLLLWFFPPRYDPGWAVLLSLSPLAVLLSAMVVQWGLEYLILPAEEAQARLRPGLDALLRRRLETYPSLDAALDETERASTLTAISATAAFAALATLVLSPGALTSTVPWALAGLTGGLGCLSALFATGRRRLLAAIDEDASLPEREIDRYSRGLYAHPDDV